MNSQLAAKTVSFVAVASALTKRAMDEVQGHRDARTKAAALQPDVLQRMLAVGCISSAQEKQASEMLGSHAETLGLLKGAIDRIAELNGQRTKIASDGAGVDPSDIGLAKASGSAKPGAYDSLTDGYTGKHTSEKKASDRALFAGLGISLGD